jgi:hypothetical protein
VKDSRRLAPRDSGVVLAALILFPSGLAWTERGDGVEMA